MESKKSFFHEDLSKGYFSVKEPETKEPIPYIVAILKLVLFYFIKVIMCVVVMVTILAAIPTGLRESIIQPIHYKMKEQLQQNYNNSKTDIYKNTSVYKDF